MDLAVRVVKVKSQPRVTLSENMKMICFQVWELSKQRVFNGYNRNSYTLRGLQMDGNTLCCLENPKLDKMLNSNNIGDINCLVLWKSNVTTDFFPSLWQLECLWFDRHNQSGYFHNTVKRKPWITSRHLLGFCFHYHVNFTYFYTLIP